MLVEKIDALGERENAGVSRENHCHSSDGNEQRLDIACNLVGGRGTGEEGEAEVHEYEILRKLSQCREYVLG